MFTQLSPFMRRIALGKTVGFLFAIWAFLVGPLLDIEVSSRLVWGFFFWYVTFGAIIGAFGGLTHAPYINMPMPWWFRGAYVGAWLNLIIVLLSYETLDELMLLMFGEQGFIRSPYWLVLEGAIVGLSADYVATRFAGEGEELLRPS